MTVAGPVVVAAGGTGGHIFPALAVADVLEQQDVPVVWIGTREGLEARLVPAANIDIHWINVAGLRGKGLVKTLIAPWKMFLACWQSLRLLRTLQPRAVLGMGGFVSGPVGLAAWVLRRPLILHEQNAIAGLTNRCLSRVAARVFSAMPDVFPMAAHPEVVGNPVRADIIAVNHKVKDAGLNTPLKVLVIGGSRGARVLNETVPQAAGRLPAGTLEVRHQTGAADFATVQAAYDDHPDVEVLEFVTDMAAAYGWADVVVCRAGAMTVSELAAAGLPAVLVPFPYAVDDHQTLNARWLSDAGGAILMPQTELTAETLADTLLELNTDRQRLERMSENARERFVPNAAEHIAAALTDKPSDLSAPNEKVN